MKKRRFLLTAALASLLGVGVFAGVSNKINAEKSEPVAVEAGTTSINQETTIYLNTGSLSSWYDPYINYRVGDDEWHFEQMTSSSGSLYFYNVPTNTQIIQFNHTTKWHDNCYTDQMTPWADSNGLCNQYTFTGQMSGNWGYNTGHSYTIAYNSNGGTGTIANQQVWLDNATVNNGSAFSKSDYALLSWNTNADGSGTSVSLGEIRTFSKTLSYKKDVIVTLYAQWSDYKKGRYIVGDFGSCSWGIEGAVLMTYNGTNQEWSITGVTLNSGDSFKIAYYNGISFDGSSFVGYQTIITSCGGLFCFGHTGEGDVNIECIAGGQYSFYYRDSGWDDKHISIEITGESRTAEQLAAKLMSFSESAGTCGNNDRFPAMKSMYLTKLSAGEKSKFQGFASSKVTLFKNGYDRYIAWAAALGQKPWEEGAVHEAFTPLSINDGGDGTTVALVVVMSVVSITAIGGFFFMKKKKFIK